MNDYQVLQDENAHWREIADYERVIQPLINELQKADWAIALKWHAARWHKEFCKTLRFSKTLPRWRDMCCVRPKPVLIPNPVQLAQKKRIKAHELFRQVRANMHEREFATSPLKRRYLAEQLKQISLDLGRLVTQPINHLTQGNNVPKLELSEELKQVLHYEHYVLPNWLSWPGPEDLGQIQAKVDHFWYCLQKFEESEQAATSLKASTDTGASTAFQPATTRSRELERAVLGPGVTLDEVRTLLHQVGMGEKFAKPGEWAAALRALHEAHVLRGAAPAITRWAIEQKYIKCSALETVKKVWTEERTEPEQFTNATHKTVFRNTRDAAVNLLNTKKLIVNSK